MGFISSDHELVDLLGDYKMLAYNGEYETQVVSLASDLVGHAEYIWSLKARGMDTYEAVDRVLMILEVLEQDTSDHYPNIQQALKGVSVLELREDEAPQDNMLAHRVQKLLKKIQRQFALDAAFSKASRVAVRKEKPLLPIKPPSEIQECRVVPEEDVKEHRKKSKTPVPFLGEAEIFVMSDFVKVAKPEQHKALQPPRSTRSAMKLALPLEVVPERRIVPAQVFEARLLRRQARAPFSGIPEVVQLFAPPAHPDQQQNTPRSGVSPKNG